MIRKLLLAITCITLCSCGTSHRPLENENAQPSKGSLRDKIVELESIYEKYFDKTLALELEYFYSFTKEYRNGYLDFLDELYEEGKIGGDYTPYLKTTRKNLKWFRETIYKIIEGQILPKELVHPKYGRSNLNWAFENELYNAFPPGNSSTLYIKQLRNIGKRIGKGEFYNDYEFQRGVAFGDSIRSITSNFGPQTPEAARRYFQLKERHPLKEQSEMFLYGRFFSGGRYDFAIKNKKLFGVLYPSSPSDITIFKYHPKKKKD